MKARKVKKLDPAGALDQNAARIVLMRIEELRSFAEEAMSPGAVTAQHDMRIAAKRLRYLLEVVGFCFGEEAEVARKRARQLQGLLGEMHDCDEMLPRVQAEIERLRSDDARTLLLKAGDAEDLAPGLVTAAPNRSAYSGLELLAVHLQARRALLFERFRGFWQEQASLGTWARLESAAAKDLGATPQPAFSAS
jgi:hypothetical protein